MKLKKRWWLIILALGAAGGGVYASTRSEAQATPKDSALRIDVTGRQWWWEVRYADSTSGRLIVLANEIHIPTGRPVELVLTTSDVIHSLWVPALAGKVDMIPGRTNRLVVRADRPGVFRGQCAEYCGGQHALMALYVVAQPEAEFRRWLANEAEPDFVSSRSIRRLDEQGGRGSDRGKRSRGPVFVEVLDHVLHVVGRIRATNRIAVHKQAA